MTLLISVFSFFLNFFIGNNALDDVVSVSHHAAVSSPYHDTLNLSKYKGKIIVLNFWASWSKASRVENKNLVRIFQQYRTGLKVVFISVSLDTDETSWKSAIEEDNMEWKNHYCDFLKYDSPMAKSHEVNTLPFICLYDKTGSKVQTTSRVQEIETAIEGLLK